MPFLKIVLILSINLTIVTCCDEDDPKLNKPETFSTIFTSYNHDSSVVANPERGWFIFPELKPTFSSNSNNWATAALLDNYYEQGYRLAKHIIIIPTNGELIPESFFDKLRAEAELFREKGFKVIYRFTYNWNHDYTNEDAPLNITLAHLDQFETSFLFIIY